MIHTYLCFNILFRSVDIYERQYRKIKLLSLIYSEHIPEGMDVCECGLTLRAGPKNWENHRPLIGDLCSVMPIHIIEPEL